MHVLRSLTVAAVAGASSLMLPAVANAADGPRIVTTIPPVHSLVAAVAEGVTTPHLMLRGGASPHTYAMAPSDARALQDADLVVWVGPSLETFMVRALRDPRPGRHVVTLMEGSGIEILAAREGGPFDAHDHGHGHDDEHAHDDDHGHDEKHAHAHDDHGHDEKHAHDHDHDHGHDEKHAHAHDDDHGHDEKHAHDHGHDEHAHDGHMDAHIWLDPRNASRIVELIAKELVELDPDHASIYRANAARATERLARLDSELTRILDPAKERSFIVFHDAYQYFERRYGLTVAGSITVSPEREPGARRLREIHDRLTNAGVACVFAEPQFPPNLVATVIEGTEARGGVADPLGAELDPGPGLYPALMEGLARSLAECLSPQS